MLLEISLMWISTKIEGRNGKNWLSWKKHDPNFKGFYVELSYWDRLDRCISNFDSLISSILDEINNKGAPQYSKDYISIDVDD